MKSSGIQWAISLCGLAQGTLGTVPLVGFGTHELQGFGASGHDCRNGQEQASSVLNVF